MKTNKIIAIALIISAVMLLTACTSKKNGKNATSSPTKSTAYSYTINISKNPKIGSFLVGPDGMTLYSLANETDNHIICKGDACLKIWPIFYSKNISLPKELNTKEVKVFKRPDGLMQISYDNHPLYYFAGSKKFNLTGDKKPGDTFGNNVKGPEGVWHIVKLQQKGKTTSW